MRVNVGCGDIKKDGYVGIDIRKTKAAEIVGDFNKIDLKNVTEIYGRMSLHHFPDPSLTLKKCKKICNGKIFFEREPVRGILIPESIAYHFSGYRNLRDDPEEKAPTLPQWVKWFAKSGLKLRTEVPKQGRIFSKAQNKVVNFIMMAYAFYFGNPFRPFSYWSVNMESNC